ncbi:Carboxy-terminal domain (CTD) phosphatase [Tulasnella sp. 419]|nr:Carboxy-terminal domain (CTD) phosphatase [Tulasnella sp. 419]
MVVVIDDRADVWQYSPNLVKVIPYDFFVGIGDINASFLPKSPDLLAGNGNVPKAQGPVMPESPGTTPPDALAASPLTASPTPPSTEPSLTKEEAQSVLVAQAQSKAVEAQLEERPLAKMQEALEAQVEGGATPSGPSLQNGNSANGNASSSSPKDTKNKALLRNDDNELERVWQILEEIHQRFFDLYDRNIEAGIAWNSEQSKSQLRSKPDVKAIIPAMKAEVLAGVHLLFSGVIPLKTNPARSEAWKYAREFGARCYTELVDVVTHIVAAQPGTSKVESGLRKPNIKVMKARWFQDCIALWKHLPETDEYLLDPERALRLQGRESAPSPKSSANGSVAGAQDATDTPKPDDDGNEDDAPDFGDTGTPGGMDVDYSPLADDVDWADVDREVDEFLNESDEDEQGDGDQNQGEMAEDEKMEGNDSTPSVPPSPRLGALKRRRSSTPSGSNSLFGSDTEDDRSPLAKRKKLTAERRGASGLKVEVSLEEDDDEEGDEEAPEAPEAPNGEMSSVKNANPASSDSEAPGDADESSSDDSSGDESPSSGEDEEFLAGLEDGDGWG